MSASDVFRPKHPFDLRVVCTGRSTHRPVELGVIVWWPAELERDGLAVSDAARDLALMNPSPMGDSARGTKSARPNKQVKRAAVHVRVRSDGGKTFVLPPCPKCGQGTGRELRDDTVARYFEATRDTPAAGVLDVSLRLH